MLADLRENKRLRWVAVAAWMGLIFFLSAQPQLPHVIPSMVDFAQDVLGHFVAYGILGGLLYWALTGAGVRRAGVRRAGVRRAGVRRAALLTLLVVFLYALSDEFHQSFVPHRHPDPFDVLTDVVGASAALLLLNLRRSLRRRRS